MTSDLGIVSNDSVSITLRQMPHQKLTQLGSRSKNVNGLLCRNIFKSDLTTVSGSLTRVWAHFLPHAEVTVDKVLSVDRVEKT